MPRYLVVDDSRTIRMRLTQALREKEKGADIEEAADGPAALEAFGRKGADLVFLDMMLPPPVGGLDVLRDILDQEPDARVVLLTALPQDHPDVVSAISLGAFAHLPKPLTSDGVRAVLQRVEMESGRMGRIK